MTLHQMPSRALQADVTPVADVKEPAQCLGEAVNSCLPHRSYEAC